MSYISKHKIKVERIENIKIDLTNEELNRICNNLLQCFLEKSDKFIKSLNSCDYCYFRDCVIVNDNLCVNSDIYELASSLGFFIKNIDSTKFGLKGKTYIIKDNNLAIISALGGDINLPNNIQRLTIDSLLKIYNSVDATRKFEISNITQKAIQSIRGNEKITNKVIDTIEIKKDNNREISRTILNSKGFMQIKYSAAIKDLNRMIDKQNEKNKKDIINGTKYLITLKAKKMGYTVQERNIENKVELVLVKRA